MDVIIVSKTQMKNNVCVGGILANGKHVRLLKANGYYQDPDTKFNIGDVYTINFIEKSNPRPPHVEDILVTSQQFKFSFESVQLMTQYLTNKLNIDIWQGRIDLLFDGKLQWTDKNSGYISEQGGVSDRSTGFWILDQDLVRNDYGEKVRYDYQLPLKQPDSIDDLWNFIISTQTKHISFVGFQEPIAIIPAGTLVRVSLARWWTHENEEKCFLQLSGWYH